MAIAISRADAIVRVKNACAWDQTPAVDESIVERAVDAAARPDAAGNAVEQHDTAESWISTYDLNAACAAVWEAKAARVAGRFDLAVDDQRLDRSQIHKHCLDMAATYRGRTAGAIGRRTFDLQPSVPATDSFQAR